MATIARLLPDTPRPDPWAKVARQVHEWAIEREIALRDTVVLVPFVQLLAPARRAFASTGGWMPRVETVRTMAASLGPPTLPGSGEIGHGIALDTLVAMQTLARQPWGGEWSRRDPRGFERGAASVVAAAHELVAASVSVALEERNAWWEQASEGVRSLGGPDGKERLLARIAIEWAARSAAPATDRLFAMKPAAWVSVVAGGADRLTMSLFERAAAPTLVIDTDASLADPFRETLAEDGPTFAVCDSFEDEASAAAAQVITELEQGVRPVALIAQDRVLVRRIRALLEQSGVALSDETGWKLSTTRAGASAMALLVAARHDATADAWLDWLKSAPFAASRSSALASFEAACRRAQVSDAHGLARLDLDAHAAALRNDAAGVLEALSVTSRRTLVGWLDAFATALDRTGSLRRLRDDAAGRQALSALGIDPAIEPERRQSLASDLEPMLLADFTRWAGDVLERETFLPPDPLDADGTPLAIDVVITPLARAMLRPFAAVVLAGADDRQLGAMAGADSLLPRALAEALALPGPADQRDADLLAFAQLLRLPRVTLLRRRADGADPLGDSAFVERLALSLAERGAVLRPWHDPRVELAIEPRPIAPTAPSVPAARLPQRLSASAFEALRACPYRFFSRSVLGLREADELDPEIEKRDYGSWLHGVLHEFHLDREADGDRSDQVETARLLAVGAASLEAQGLDEAGFLPFSASFAVLAPRYVAWLHERERRGAAWERGEVELSAWPPELGGVELYGRIDRIDTLGGGKSQELIDYKTGSASKLKADVRDRYEDTQLAFYAALVGDGCELPLKASYLALDATRGLEEFEHIDVAESAKVLVAGIADELHRLREGAVMSPLGEGSACDYCEARGLCRRDHWSLEPVAILRDEGKAQ